MGLLRMMGLAPSKNDQKLRELVTQSYTSVQVVGRGTVKIDPDEVRNSAQFKNAQNKARAIVEAAR